MGKKITLPNREEMLRRLLEVNDDADMQAQLYPLLLEYAGRKPVAMGVVIMLMNAIHDFTKDSVPAMATLVSVQAPDFIDALVTDPEVASEAKTILKEAQEALGRN